MKKYKIDEYLYSLNVTDYKKASRLIPKILGVAFNTFHNYRRIEIDDPQDIPYEKVIAMEKLFGLEAGKLANRDLNFKTLREIFNEPSNLGVK
ncbi:hypothetical protein SAMN05421820_11161 [Pedobacter steynii]|uniref:Uncharacterized protein n=1 Tax=Pedobacter steynii TaxID=430522 RepID=A0A1H0G6V1_9SPHI|nr:hypothetical protein [Pedobacter steynii]NQX42341.1 hypothetical protein [Pedobacter steynii]SDO02627.1 hypothetical protein SAMN05421820_11161 [Pedobacter steynii]